MLAMQPLLQAISSTVVLGHVKGLDWGRVHIALTNHGRYASSPPTFKSLPLKTAFHSSTCHKPHQTRKTYFPGKREVEHILLCSFITPSGCSWMLFLGRPWPASSSLPHTQKSLLFAVILVAAPHDRADKFNSDCSGTRWQLKTKKYKQSWQCLTSKKRKGRVRKCSWGNLVKGSCYWAAAFIKVFPKVTLILPLSPRLPYTICSSDNKAFIELPTCLSKTWLHIFLSRGHLFSLFSLPLFILSPQTGQNSWILKGSSHLGNSWVQPHQNFVNAVKISLCYPALIMSCSYGIMQPRFMRTIADKTAVSLICYWDNTSKTIIFSYHKIETRKISITFQLPCNSPTHIFLYSAQLLLYRMSKHQCKK